MTTSNNITWELSRNQIIESALRKIGALAKGQSADTEDLTNGSQALNSVTALMVTDGMPLWKRTTVNVPLVAGTAGYTITGATKIEQVVLQILNGTTQYQLIRKSLHDFNMLPTSNGSLPVHWYFAPEIQDGVVTIWPTPDSSAVANYRLVVVYQREFDGFFSATETPDFPPYWTDALIYQLACRLAPEYGVPIQDRQLLTKEAEMYKDMASRYGDDEGSLYVMPDTRW